MNALGGKHPIPYCTWRKNPEERRVSDGPTPTDPDQTETRRCLQHSVDSKVMGTISTYFRGGHGGAWRSYLFLFISEQETGGSRCDSDAQRATRNQLHTSFYLND